MSGCLNAKITKDAKVLWVLGVQGRGNRGEWPLGKVPLPNHRNWYGLRWVLRWCMHAHHLYSTQGYELVRCSALRRGCFFISPLPASLPPLEFGGEKREERRGRSYA